MLEKLKIPSHENRQNSTCELLDINNLRSNDRSNNEINLSEELSNFI